MTIKSIDAMKSHIYHPTSHTFSLFWEKSIPLHLKTMHELYPHFYFNDDCEHFIYSTCYPMDIHWILLFKFMKIFKQLLSILKYFTLDIQRQKSSFVVYFINHFHRAFVYRNAVHFHFFFQKRISCMLISMKFRSISQISNALHLIPVKCWCNGLFYALCYLNNGILFRFIFSIKIDQLLRLRHVKKID